MENLSHNGQIFISERSGIIMTPAGKVPAPRAAEPQQRGGGTKWVPWGEDNQFPQRVNEAASKSTVIPPAIDRKARLSYAGGIQAGRRQYIDNKEVFVPERYKPFEAFKKRNNLNRYLMEAFSDLYWFVNFFPNLILSRDRSEIVQLFIEEASHCRWGWQNETTGLVDTCFISANWATNPETDVFEVPVIDPYWDAAGQLKARKDGHRFIYPVSYPSPNKFFYQLAPWNGAISSGWLEFSLQIPAFKTFMMKNQISLKYHLEVNEDYWPTLYKGWKDMKAEEQQLNKNKFLDDFNAKMTSEKNAMKTLLTGFALDKTGKEVVMWKVTPIDDKIKSGVFVEDSSEAVAHLLNALDVDPSLFPHIQGKGQTSGSGSDKNSAYNLFIASIKPYHDLVLEPLNVIRDYNGWDEEIEFQIGTTFMSSSTSGKPTLRTRELMAFKTLFKLFDEFCEFVPTGKEMDPDFIKLPPQIDIAQNSFIVKEIGRELFQELLDVYQTGTPSEIQLEAINKLRAPLANFTMFLFLPKHKVQVDSQGLRVNENEQQKDSKPFDTTAALEAYLRDAYSGIEQALEFLELKKSDFSTWTASKAYTAFSKGILRSNSELEMATGVLVTRRLFRFIKPHIFRIENQQLKAVLGKDLLEELLTQIQANTVSVANQKILDIARPAVAYMALSDAMSLSEVEWSDQGITILSNAINSNVSRGKVAAPDNKIANLTATCRTLGPEQLERLDKFLNENAADYPLFTVPEVFNGGPLINKADAGTFML